MLKTSSKNHVDPAFVYETGTDEQNEDQPLDSQRNIVYSDALGTADHENLGR